LGKEVNHWKGKDLNEATIRVSKLLQGTYFMIINGLKADKVVLL